MSRHFIDCDIALGQDLEIWHDVIENSQRCLAIHFQGYILPRGKLFVLEQQICRRIIDILSRGQEAHDHSLIIGFGLLLDPICRINQLKSIVIVLIKQPFIQVGEVQGPGGVQRLALGLNAAI